MVTNKELFVILRSFYRSTDGILISVIEKRLILSGFTRKGIIKEALHEGILKQITSIRVILTNYGQQVYRKAKKDKII